MKYLLSETAAGLIGPSRGRRSHTATSATSTMATAAMPTRRARREPWGLAIAPTIVRLRLAIISDIHANLPALEAVLADVEGASVDELWCLGDVVGYGAQPDDCAALVAERCELCLVGNHDLAVLGELDISAFSPAAAAAVRWTRDVAKPTTLEFLRGLEPADESHEVALYHASPRDPVWEYVLWPDQAAECIGIQAARVSLIGHSHVALFFVMPSDQNRPEGSGRAAGRRAGRTG